MGHSVNDGLDESGVLGKAGAFSRQQKALVCGTVVGRLLPHVTRLGMPAYGSRVSSKITGLAERLFDDPIQQLELIAHARPITDDDFETLYPSESEAEGDERQFIQLAIGSLIYAWQCVQSNSAEELVYCCRMLTDSVFLYYEATAGDPETMVTRQASEWSHPLLRAEVDLRDSILSVAGDAALDRSLALTKLQELARLGRAPRGTIWGAL